jgi:hypothetical protein
MRVRRSRVDPGHLDGYVIGIGKRWLLLAVPDSGIRFDGYTAVRIKDLTGVRAAPYARFVEHALTLRSQWPPQPLANAVNLDTRRALLRSFAGGYPVVTVHPERFDPDVCFVGRVTGVGKRSVRLKHVTPAGKWEKPVTRHRLGWITKVDVGGSYEQALLMVAGPS